jgi:hypothetical protein
VNAAQISCYKTGIEKIQATRRHIAQMNAQINRDISVLETTCRAVERMLAELTVHRGEVEITVGAVEECLRTARTEAASATVASAVAVAQD